MSSVDNPLLRLEDFVAWVRKRRPHQENAWIDEATLEYVVQGVERFLDGKKNPWPKPKGNKAKRDVMWACYYHTNFADADKPHLPQHTEPGGAFAIVGERFNFSGKNAETHASNARKLLDTEAGRRDFLLWLNENVYGPKGLAAVLYGPDRPESETERKRRDVAGVGKRKPGAVSGEIDPE